MRKNKSLSYNDLIVIEEDWEECQDHTPASAQAFASAYGGGLGVSIEDIYNFVSCVEEKKAELIDRINAEAMPWDIDHLDLNKLTQEQLTTLLKDIEKGGNYDLQLQK